MKVVGKIGEIRIFPIKSFAGIRVEKARIHKYGLAHYENPKIIDRKWMVVNSETGSFLTQRQLPRMALIKPRIDDDFIILSAPDMPDLRVPVQPPTTIIRQCRVWNLKIDGYPYGDEIAKWISDFLGQANLDLVCFGEDLAPRKCADIDEKSNRAHENDFTIYEDYSPYMIISQASLDDLNKRLKKPVTMDSFRPNFTAVECEQAYAEDGWNRFRIGNSATFYKIKDCVRCTLTTVDPNSSQKNADQEPLKTLKEYRSNKELYDVSPMFGMHFSPEQQQQTSSDDLTVVSVGDEIIDITD